jgi:DNA-binding NarL/FixJ family response regulator
MGYPIKLLIVDDHPFIREALRHLLSAVDGILVVDEAVNGKEAIDKVKSGAFDVVLMDLMMPEMNGIVATKYVTQHFPQVKVLALTLYNNQNYVADMLSAGALGYLAKTVDKDTLVSAIRTVAGGNSYLHTA